MQTRRYELTDFEWSIIGPLLPNKPRGVPRADDRTVLNGIYWRLRTGSPWADIPERYCPYTTCYNVSCADGRPACGIGFSKPFHRATTAPFKCSIVRRSVYGVAIEQARLGSDQQGLQRRHALGKLCRVNCHTRDSKLLREPFTRRSAVPTLSPPAASDTARPARSARPGQAHLDRSRSVGRMPGSIVPYAHAGSPGQLRQARGTMPRFGAPRRYRRRPMRP